jgi:hypothetical protein
MRFKASLNTSDHGSARPFKDAGVVATSSIMTTNTTGKRKVLTVKSILDTSSSSALT